MYAKLEPDLFAVSFSEGVGGAGCGVVIGAQKQLTMHSVAAANRARSWFICFPSLLMSFSLH